MDNDDDYVFYGKALPEYEDEYTTRKKAAKELQVRDEKGRQRFHGAFTGGFSAGYYNTVGTKEGWAPSSFISSRAKTAGRFQQNPEDFMDEEDFGEFGIATRKIHTASDFQDLSDGNTRKRKLDDDAVIPGEAPLKDLVKPVKESIGIKILKKLGWRPGQGIGPRVKKQTSVKIYGCSMLPDNSFSEEDDPIMLSYTFAPKDTDEIFYDPKDNYFGLGYVGLSKKSVLSHSADDCAPTSTKSWLAKDKKKLSISGQAFGVGAFEDDDEDIYSKDDMSQYDFSELAPKGKKESDHKLKEKILLENGVLEGFILASTLTTQKKYYSPPELPPNYKPISKFPPKKQSIEERQIKPHQSLSSVERSLMLGEKKFQSFQLNSGFQKVQKIPEGQQESPALSNNMAPNFRPFPNDSEKQQRYENYLNFKRTGEIEKFIQPSTMTEWEKQQEKEEFAKAAVLFKPLSAALNSRFESRSHLSVEHEVMEALEKIKGKKEEKPSPVKSLIGSHNRRTVDWYPASLLCRRFNVPNPYPDSSSTGVPASQKEKKLFEHIPITSNGMSNVGPALDCSVSNASKKDEEISSEHKVTSLDRCSVNVEKEKNKDNLLENERPPMDLFKDIFGNSSSEDENSTSVKEVSSATSNTKELSKTNPADIASQDKPVLCDKQELTELKKPPSTTPKVGFGVFANLDLDALNQRAVNVQKEVKNAEIPISEPLVISSVKSNVEIDLYGPKLPPNYSSSFSGQHKTNSRKHAKHKTKHKHKHKHKSHKKKKKSSKKDSDTSDSSEDDDVPPNLIIEKLKELQRKII